MNSTISSFKDLLMSSKQPICILIDDFHLIYNGDDLLWFTSTFIPYIKYIITIPQTAEENSEILSKIHLTYYDKGFEMLKIECSEDQWSDIILHGVGDICSSGLTVNLLETLGSNTDRTLVKAKIIWWLAWLGVKELTQKTLQTLSFKVLEILENIFGRKMVSFIMSIIHASRSGLSESDIIQLLQYYFGEICGVSNTSSFWGFFSWLISPFLFNEQYINFMDSTIYMAIQEKYGTYVKDAHKQPNKFSNEKGYSLTIQV
uniref:CSON004218 protein n=1 Tax=Culicoides sonorensis TaxID=179676 RepID=A0A336N130_CULSO